jgi:hypothetical protein
VETATAAIGSIQLIIDVSRSEIQKTRLVFRFGGAAAVLMLGVLGWMPPPHLIGLLALVGGLQVIQELFLYLSRQNSLHTYPVLIPRYIKNFCQSDDYCSFWQVTMMQRRALATLSVDGILRFQVSPTHHDRRRR